jgi:hypothetical protein
MLGAYYSTSKPIKSLQRSGPNAGFCNPPTPSFPIVGDLHDKVHEIVLPSWRAIPDPITESCIEALIFYAFSIARDWLAPRRCIPMHQPISAEYSTVCAVVCLMETWVSFQIGQVSPRSIPAAQRLLVLANSS